MLWQGYWVRSYTLLEPSYKLHVVKDTLTVIIKYVRLFLISFLQMQI
jgi:hypothetical protein